MYPEQESALIWYEVNIAGMQFKIASRKGKAHIEAVENRICQTMEVLREKINRPPLNLAILTAFNMADQLIDLEQNQHTARQNQEERLLRLVERLQTLDAEPQAQVL